jgi:hypothetical protein
MKDLIDCNLIELIQERDEAVNAGNIQRYRECNEIISTVYQVPTRARVLIDCYDKDSNGNTLHVNGKYVIRKVSVELPIIFKYDGHRGCMKVNNTDIRVDDIISIREVDDFAHAG